MQLWLDKVGKQKINLSPCQQYKTFEVMRIIEQKSKDMKIFLFFEDEVFALEPGNIELIVAMQVLYHNNTVQQSWERSFDSLRQFNCIEEDTKALDSPQSTASRDNSDDPYSDPEMEFYRGLQHEDLNFDPSFGKVGMDLW